jgi:hypothetical protein
MRKLNLEIIPQGGLNLLSIESTLQDRIIMSQLHDEGIKIINFVNKSLMKHICLNSLFILVAPKCIKIFDSIFGGPE